MNQAGPKAGRKTRIIGAMIIGLFVFLISLLAAFTALRGLPPFYYRQAHTNYYLRVFQLGVEQYHEDWGGFPLSLQDLRDAEGDEEFHIADAVDAWDRPLLYSSDHETFDIWSYGRDGEPGGAGYDADMHCHDKSAFVKAMPTLHQFLVDPLSTRIQWACAASGVLAALLYYRFSRKTNASHAYSTISNIVATLVFSLIAATVLVVAHIPSGH